MKLEIENTFPQCVANTCLQSVKHSKFWINDPNDDQTKCELTIEENPNNHFEVENLTEKEIHFLAIDKCIFQDSDEHQKCDFAIFDDESFCWVEIKMGKGKRNREKRNKAVQQLKTTIRIFKEKLDFGSYQLEAKICFRARSYNEVYPRFTASNAGLIKEFQDEFRVKLTQGNKKIF